MSSVKKVKKNGADIIVDYLIEEKVPYAFGLCGHGNVGLLDSLVKNSDKIKTISVRHESAAGFMADAYYRISHKPVATFTSCGPGSANLPVTLGAAIMDSSAYFAITGNVPTTQFNRSPFQETGRFFQGDFPSVVKPYVKRSYQPMRVEMVPLAVRQGFKEMETGTPGPVHLDVPLNVFVEEMEVDVIASHQIEAINQRSGTNDQVIDQILQLLKEAKRPLIAAGNGAILSHASEVITELSDYLNIPVHTTPQGKGIIDERKELSLGACGRNGTYAANEAGKNCDVLIAFGSSFDDRVTSAWLDGYTYDMSKTKLVHVDISGHEIGKNYPVHLGVIGDARTVAQQILDKAKEEFAEVAPDYSVWIEEIKSYKKIWKKHVEESFNENGTPVHPARLVHEVRKALPEDGILGVDVGVHHNWVVQYWDTYSPQKLLQSWGFASMGLATCGILGAKLASPESACVAIVGDGSFIMHGHILATAKEYNIPVVWVVWNNYAYGSIRDLQHGYFGGRELATSFKIDETEELYNPDFVALAKSYGVDSKKVTQADEISEAVQEAIKLNKPYLIEVEVARDIKPPGTGTWSLPPFPHPEPNFLAK
ncbi:thiamine pyrophosphate-binding protein [Sporosarcina highlanderae]|uniref:Thiamine pyrophosphate-binding protein n=1 Tax=Sporosarcina highlanderae TaxID=3035916 RepID=A0ABT8JVG5_9BACL|nr:thiamine pyrophosphate-binding protein [Sporosarcina highlanderae]MDN4609170.1 thiamine pyrophosphate-binding protein [Sporosarcina highlanderae]